MTASTGACAGADAIVIGEYADAGTTASAGAGALDAAAACEAGATAALDSPPEGVGAAEWCPARESDLALCFIDGPASVMGVWPASSLDALESDGFVRFQSADVRWL